MSIASPLFPVPASRISCGFTTSPSVNIDHVEHVELSDTTLGVHKVSPRTTHKVVIPPTPPASSGISSHCEAWEACYPKDSINPTNKHAPPGGFGFYMWGPSPWNHRLTGEASKEVMMSYEVLFADGWEWRKGGKLPGIYGGVGESAYGCTGGRQTDRCKCFDLRFMWREGGKAELYAYMPPKEENVKSLLSIPPLSIQHADFGFSVGRGAWTFVPGKWTTIAERVKMNDVGRSNGEIEVYVDGRSVIYAKGLIFRDDTSIDSCVKGMHTQTFFGGHTDDWASPKDQKAYFANISGAILEAASDVYTEL